MSASEKQIDFATAIAEMLGTELPDFDDEFETSWYITEHIDDFYKEKNRQRYEDSDTVFSLEHSYVLGDGFNGDMKLNINPSTVAEG